jgi:TonB-dependent SusC/RagA subfamily outer membrane receptor
MTVLKDAASNALYGARGANGVIIITTKRANMSGEAKVTFDAKWGANTRALKKYDVITDPAMYYEMHYGAMKNYYMNQMNMSDQAAWIEANNNLFGSNGGLGYNVFTVPKGSI